MATDSNEYSYELSDQYLQHDFPSKYKEFIINGTISSEEVFLKVINDFFQSGKYKGAKMVEVGCGPTIYRLATPSKYYDEIITSDYAPENKESVRKWLAGDPQALDWTPHLEIVAKAEGYSDLSKGIKDIEARIRQKTKSVIHCDVLKEQVFVPDIDAVDFLTTAGCLEGVCPSRAAFTSAVKKLGSYVKPGGYIMMLSALGMSVVPFDGNHIKVLDIDEEFVHQALKDAGFVVEQRFFRENDIPEFNFVGCVIIIARKIKFVNKDVFS